jgi:hypothetical protein
VEILECIDHEGIERKYQGAGNQRKRRESPAQFRLPDSGFKCGQTPQKEPAEIDLDKERDAENKPRDHNEDRQLSVRGIFQKGDIIAERWNDLENYQGVKATKHQSREESEFHSRANPFTRESHSREDLAVMRSPEGQGEISDELRGELYQLLAAMGSSASAAPRSSVCVVVDG